MSGRIRNRPRRSETGEDGSYDALFASEAEFLDWEKRKNETRLRQGDLSSLDGKDVFLGVDAGSTTTKIVLVDDSGALAWSRYAMNNGSSLEAVHAALKALRERLHELGVDPVVRGSSATGYGEEMVKAAFGLDHSLVETLAHYRAASCFQPDVSFILDIGGQDMKAMRIEDGSIQSIAINEACSSGCGSFIQTLATTTGNDLEGFTRDACSARAPFNLGTRCTVFMNSKIKECLKDGVSVADISAGLAFSVVRNCFNKVLKVSCADELGGSIVVQGGTFKNPAVLRALEVQLGREVTRPRESELMGAYGCALHALEQYRNNGKSAGTFSLENLESALHADKKTASCKGCENTCSVTLHRFANGRRSHSGNKCEEVFGGQTGAKKGRNMYSVQYDLLFERSTRAVGRETPAAVIGMPRALNMYENYPFWCTLFTHCGFDVRLSPPTSGRIQELGAPSVMSDNICFPAKLVHGHILELIDSGVDRIFYPTVTYEEKTVCGAGNSFNCPVVTGYPDLIRNSIDPEARGIAYDTPLVNFDDREGMRASCRAYMSGLGVGAGVFEQAFERALAEQERYRRDVAAEATSIMEDAAKEGKPLVLLAGRPYHLDPAINHRIPEIVTSFGASVVTLDSVPADIPISGIQVLNQWEYSNRVYRAATWSGAAKKAVFMQLNSFGCGPDSIVLDETRSILASSGVAFHALRIDEIASTGSTRLRIRSILEAGNSGGRFVRRAVARRKVADYTASDRTKTIIAPTFAPLYSGALEKMFSIMGYRLEVLPEPDRESVEVGLRYVNNEICYPAIVCIGDVIKALQSGRYDPRSTVAAITETGGQCRASNYAALLKKALLAAGFDTVPVVTLAGNQKGQNKQSGFKFNKAWFSTMSFSTLLLTDALSRLYFASVAREKNAGDSRAVLDAHLEMMENAIGPAGVRGSTKILESAVRHFNAVAVTSEEKHLRRVGILGEIYVNFNPFANFHVADWLSGRGVEVVLPSLMSFFSQMVVGIPYKHRNHVKKSSRLAIAGVGLLGRHLASAMRSYNGILSQYRFPVTGFTPIETIAENASSVVNIVNQYGEGWLLPGEAVTMAREGVNDIVCLQPFGCIANHIIGKGISARMKELYPQLSMLFLDCDPGVSEVNFFNRLHMLLESGSSDARLAYPPAHDC